MTAEIPGAGLILSEISDGVALLTLNRPDKLNALNGEMLSAAATMLEDLAEHPDVRAIVLTGSTATKRPSFAAGADISEMAKMTGLQMREYSALGQAVCDLLEQMPKPTIAAVNGFALGGGCEVAMACHMRIASTAATFGQPEINLGILPGFGGSQRLTRILGRGRALEVLLSGEPMDAAGAERLGLVNRVVEPQVLMESALTLARKFAGKAPLAREFILDAVTRGADLTLAAALSLETDLFGLLGSSEDVKEGMRAFLEKRPAQWKGR